MEVTLKEHDYNLYIGTMIALAMKEARYTEARLWGYAYKTMFEWLNYEYKAHYWYVKHKDQGEEKKLKCIINDKQRAIRAITDFATYLGTKDNEVAKGLKKIENLIMKG